MKKNTSNTCNSIKRRRHTAALLAVMLAALLAGFASVPRFAAFAAGGSVTVSVPAIEDLDTDAPEFDGFTFRVYEVGGYSGANFTLKPEYADLGVNVNIPKKAEYDAEKGESDPSWEEAWLAQANTLANHIMHPAPAEDGTPGVVPDAEETFTGIMPGESFTFSSNRNALYLIIGETVRAGDFNWTPVPAFIRTLNGTETFTYSNDAAVKMIREKVVFDHSIAKIWDDSDNSAGVRPSQIDAGIYYGEELIDTVTLGGESGKWTYTWRSTETGSSYKYTPGDETMSGSGEKTFTPSEGADAWSVREFTQKDGKPTALRFYEPEYSKGQADSGTEAFYITNRLTSKSIEITKILDGYVDDGHNVTLSFRIDGYSETDESGQPKGEPVYTNHAGISFGRNDGLSKTVTINYIPTEVQVIKVTEEYTGNYRPDGEPEITYEGNVWKVKMNNIHDGHSHGGGVVNKYENGKDPEQQGLD